MKAILKSLFVIGLVAGLTIGATNAFFSDVETSTGNTFTAGELNLLIDSKATYNGQSVPTSSWELRDLNPTSDKFFNLDDIKPGDRGEVTVSLHVVNNDYWACLTTSNLETNGDNGLALADGLYFFIWNDKNGNNIFEPTNGEPPLLKDIVEKASSVLANKTYTLADKITGNPFPGGSLSDPTKTRYIGLAWCAGTFNVDTSTGAMSCDGASLGNEAQNGSVTADIAFRVEQARNNPNFSCNGLYRVEGSASDPNAPQLGSIHYVGYNEGYEFWFTPTQNLAFYIAGHLYHNTYRVNPADLPGYCGSSVVPNRPPYNLVGHTGQTVYYKIYDETAGTEVCP